MEIFTHDIQLQKHETWAQPCWISGCHEKSQHVKMANRPKEGGVEYIQIDGLVSNFHMIIYVRIKPTGCKISMAYSLASLNKQNLKYWC